MKAEKVRKPLTFRRLLRLTGEGLGHLFLYLIKYLPWVLLVVIYYQMDRYENFRELYCNELETTSFAALSDDELEYMNTKCEYEGPFILSLVQEVQDYADTDFKLAVIMTILLIAIIPYAITYYYYKEPFPPKTVTRTILVFIYWFLLVWLISAIIVYNPIYDWAKDLV